MSPITLYPIDHHDKIIYGHLTDEETQKSQLVAEPGLEVSQFPTAFAVGELGRLGCHPCQRPCQVSASNEEHLLLYHMVSAQGDWN